MTVLEKTNRNHVHYLQTIDSERQKRTIHAQPFTRATTEVPDHHSQSNVGKRKGRPRRYQLHLWISEREYTLLKNLAEAQDEPMSRIVRRLFGHLRHHLEREAEASCQFKS